MTLDRDSGNVLLMAVYCTAMLLHSTRPSQFSLLLVYALLLALEGDACSLLSTMPAWWKRTKKPGFSNRPSDKNAPAVTMTNKDKLNRKEGLNLRHGHLAGHDNSTLRRGPAGAARFSSMRLPPIEKTPMMVISFSSKASPRLIDLVVERLMAGGLKCLQRSSHENKTLLRLTTTQELLEETAEGIHLMKVTADTQTVEYFTVAARERFCKHPEADDDNKYNNDSLRWDRTPRKKKQAPFLDQQKQQQQQLNLDVYGLFTSNEWCLLLRRILDNITVLTDDEKEDDSSDLSRILDEQYHADYHVHYDNDGAAAARVSSSSRSSTSEYREHGAQSACLRHVLETYGLVDNVSVSHLPKLRQDILDETWKWWRLEPPVDAIQEYYGWEIAFYFAWMGFLTRWLLFPGVLGAFFFAFRWYRHDTLDEDEFTPFYGLITFLWGVMFLRFWERHEHRLAYQWGTYSLSPYERQKFFAIRPQFRGYLRKSPVTGLVETYYPPIRRRLKYIVSAVVTAAMLAVAFNVMILSLNLQGYIRPETDPKRWNEANPHPFHVRSLAALAGKDQLFDSKSTWRSLLPVVLHSVCIFSLNRIYREVAEALTSWENHETSLNHRNSLILKRFLFEAFDCYVALFYLAFYEREVDRLRMELMAVFQIDTFRRVLLECIVPMILQRVAHNKSRGKGRRLFRATSTINEGGPTEASLLGDLEKDEYEQFDGKSIVSSVSKDAAACLNVFSDLFMFLQQILWR